MKYCIKCKTQIEDTIGFCPKCGGVKFHDCNANLPDTSFPENNQKATSQTIRNVVSNPQLKKTVRNLIGSFKKVFDEFGNLR